MPWIRPRYYRWRYRRYRKRPRRTFQRRYRRRWRRVRKRHYKKKLKKFTVKEYNPKTIRKAKIKGLDMLVLVNGKKIYFNSQMYESSIVPRHLPGGGGWSVKNFSLDALYESFSLCRNVWTKGNVNLPLVKYLGCKFKLYQSLTQDYVFLYKNDFPLVSTMESYNACQPSMLMMNQHSKKVPSKLTKKKRKPYIIVRAKPPAQMQNKWYFQKEISHIPLIQTQTAACSFDNYYSSTQWDSNNIDIITLKTGLFTNTNFSNLGTTPYHCKETENNQKVYLYATSSIKQHNLIQIQELICLGNTKYHEAGYAFTDPHIPEIYKSWETYKTANQVWGNPFHEDYLNNDGTYTLFQSTTSWSTLMTKDKITPIKDLSFTKVDSFTETLRYTPNRDNGEGNQTYFKPTYTSDHSWDSPTKPELINAGFPLWLLLWGYSDFMKRTGKLTNIETSWALVLYTKTTSPIRQITVPLNESFIKGHSPFENEYNPLDYNRWYPCLQMQYEAINQICVCGPGTPKLNGRKSTEIKCSYTFYFKFGGSPPSMSEVEDPSGQPTYPIPNNQQQANTIESPRTPIQTYIYRFDTKQDILTTKAAKRIRKDWETKHPLLTDGTCNTNYTSEIQETQEPETAEETEETLMQQLKLIRLQQRQLKQRIQQLTLQT
nr:MAG: ORF1 [TTV-like mini virus]